MALPDLVELRLSQHKTSLSATQRRIMQYLMENSTKIAFQSVSEVARATDCSEATVTRLATALGFSGFAAMRTLFRQEVESQLAPGDHLEQTISQLAQGQESFLDHHFNTDMENLLGTRRSLDEATVEMVAEAICRARKIYLMGRGVDEGVVVFLANRLRRCLKTVEEVCRSTYEAMTRLALLGQEDLVITLDLPRYSRESLLIMHYAKNKGARVILITDKMDSPLVSMADITLLAHARGVAFTNSLIGMVFVANVISARALLKRERESLPAFRGLESLEKEIGHCIAWGGENLHSRSALE